MGMGRCWGCCCCWSGGVVDVDVDVDCVVCGGVVVVMNWTSGGSNIRIFISIWELEKGQVLKEGRDTDGIFRTKRKLQPVYLVLV